MDLLTRIIRNTMGKYRLVEFEKVKYDIVNIVDFVFFHVFYLILAPEMGVRNKKMHFFQTSGHLRGIHSLKH